MKPSGRIRKRLNRRRPSRSPRRAPTRLIVANVVGASPLNRLLTDTPPSARSPCPSECSASMSTASAGLLATKTRPVARSTQRKAGMPSVVPCRIPIWLAGVVAGSVGVHSMNSWLPLRIHRDSVGRVPPMTPHCSTGKGTPSSCTNRMPVTSGSATGLPRRAPRTRWAKTASLVPAVITHEAERGDAGDDPGRPEGVEERVDLHPRHHREGDVGHERLPEQGQDQGADHPERGGDGDQHRPDHQPHHGHDQGHQHDRPPARRSRCRAGSSRPARGRRCSPAGPPPPARRRTGRTRLARTCPWRLLVSLTCDHVVVADSPSGEGHPASPARCEGGPAAANPLDMTGGRFTPVFASKLPDHRGLVLGSGITVEPRGGPAVLSDTGGRPCRAPMLSQPVRRHGGLFRSPRLRSRRDQPEERQ